MADRRTEEMDDEDARLASLLALRILDTAPEERFDRVTRLAARMFGVPMAVVSLVDSDRQWFKSKVGLAIEGSPREDAFCNVTIQQPDVYVVEDARADDLFKANPFVVENPHVRFYAGQPISSRSGHRIGTLCLLDREPRTFSDAEKALLRDLAQWVEKEMVIDEELERAASVQRGLFPKAPPALDGYDLAGICVPSFSVGGDLYDFHEVPGGVALTLADVMGKGMGGAILMATVRAVLRGASRTSPPAEALGQAAAIVADDLEASGAFVTAVHARLDTGTGRVAFVDAGHGLTLVARADGVVEPLRTDGLPLGIDPSAGWDEGCVELHHGDTFVAFSDGVLDALTGGQTEEEVIRVMEMVGVTVQAHPSAQEAVAAVAAMAPGQPDDVTVVALRRT